MHPDVQRLMEEATRLTRSGDLTGATRVIQQALGNKAAAQADDGDVIDVEAHEVADADAPALPSPVGAPAARAAAEPADAPAPRTAAPAAQAPPAAAPSARTPPAAAPQPPPAAAPSVQTPPAAPTPEAFIAGRFGGAALAGRDYKLYIPPNAAQQTRPLVLMLHGCTQNPDDFAAGTGMNVAARGAGAFVLYPEQSQRANAQRCWNWFKHSHQARGRGEAKLLTDMVRDVMAKHAIDPARVYVAGLSAGGAMAANLGAAYPELFAAVGVHSGLPAGAAGDLQSALDAMNSGAKRAAAHKVPTIVFHGDADRTVHASNGEGAARAAGGVKSASDTGTTSGRRFTRHDYRGADGSAQAEHWVVHGAGHAWSGGNPRGSYADAQGPDATAEMLRFFLEHPRR